MHLAARAGALDVLEVLLEDLEKADRLEYVNAADKSGITPVFLAKQRGLLPPLHAACMLSSIPKRLFLFRNVIPTLCFWPSKEVCSFLYDCCVLYTWLVWTDTWPMVSSESMGTSVTGIELLLSFWPSKEFCSLS